MTPTQRVQAGKSALPDRFKQTQGQPGGIRSIAPSARAASYSDPVERMRGKYFDNRQDVSRDRLERRLAQQQENVFNRLTMFKPVVGSSNLLQSRTPGGPSIADVYEASARNYGPTLSEIGSDIGYGFKQVGSGLGQKVMTGEFGLLGLAKAAYEKATSGAAKAKDALVKGVEKLSDIDIEILKNKDKGQYKLTSKKPEIQEVENLQDIQMTEFDKANLIKQNIDRVSTPITEKDNTVQSAKVFDNKFLSMPATGMTQTSPTIDPFLSMPGSGYQAGVGMGIAGIPAGYEIISDYKSPETRMQELIEKNKVDNTNMFDLGINNAKNQLSELERIFDVDMR